MISDIIVMISYYAVGDTASATALLAMISVSMLIQIFMVVGQHHSKVSERAAHFVEKKP